MNKRIYGFDYLKLLLMFMICILHVLGQGGILDSLSNNTYLYYIAYYIEIICIIAVNCYVIISGYLNINKQIKINKLVILWLQVIFYSVIVSYLLYLFGYIEIDYIFLKQFLPISNNIYWFMTAYFGLYLFMPFINKLINSLNRKETKLLLITILILTLLEYICKRFYMNNGYSFLWLVFLYMIGAIIKKINLFDKIKTFKLVILFIFNSLISLIILIITNKTNMIYNYNSPINILNSILLVIIFSRITKENKIYKLSKYSLGVYLFQCNYVIWDLIYNKFILNSNINIITFILNLVKGTLILFMLGLIIEYIRDKCFKLLRYDKITYIICNYVNNNILKK